MDYDANSFNTNAKKIFLAVKLPNKITFFVENCQTNEKNDEVSGKEDGKALQSNKKRNGEKKYMI